MLDVNSLITRYFELKLNGSVIEVEPPTVKMIKKLMEVQKNNDYEGSIEILSRILSKNRQNKEISTQLLDAISIDTINEIAQEYFMWLQKVKQHPNL